MAYPLAGDRASAALLKAAPPIDVELRGMSAGTSAAYVLSGAGLALAPREDSDKPVGYSLINVESKEQRWPIGLPPEQPKPQLVPAMFELIEVELDNVELSRVLDSIGEALEVPILIDRRGLAEAKIDLAKTRVSHPARKLSYASVLDHTLGAKFLDNELRVDDAGRPFIFIRAARRGAPRRSAQGEVALILPGEQVVAALEGLGISHVVWLPDSALGPWQQALSASSKLTLVRVCREGEAWTIAAGLWLGGQRPLVVIQNTGLFESGDALRNVLFDLRLPIFAIVGYRSYLVPDSPDTAKRLTEPILQAWGIDYVLIDSAESLPLLSEHYLACQAAGRPGVALIAEGKG